MRVLVFRLLVSMALLLLLLLLLLAPGIMGFEKDTKEKVNLDIDLLVGTDEDLLHAKRLLTGDESEFSARLRRDQARSFLYSITSEGEKRNNPPPPTRTTSTASISPTTEKPASHSITIVESDSYCPKPLDNKQALICSGVGSCLPDKTCKCRSGFYGNACEISGLPAKIAGDLGISPLLAIGIIIVSLIVVLYFFITYFEEMTNCMDWCFDVLGADKNKKEKNTRYSSKTEGTKLSTILEMTGYRRVKTFEDDEDDEEGMGLMSGEDSNVDVDDDGVVDKMGIEEGVTNDDDWLFVGKQDITARQDKKG